MNSFTQSPSHRRVEIYIRIYRSNLEFNNLSLHVVPSANKNRCWRSIWIFFPTNGNWQNSKITQWNLIRTNELYFVLMQYTVWRMHTKLHTMLSERVLRLKLHDVVYRHLSRIWSSGTVSSWLPVKTAQITQVIALTEIREVSLFPQMFAFEQSNLHLL